MLSSTAGLVIGTDFLVAHPHFDHGDWAGDTAGSNYSTVNVLGDTYLYLFAYRLWNILEHDYNLHNDIVKNLEIEALVVINIRTLKFNF